MKFPYAMLRDFVQTAKDAEAIGELLTMAGFELEGIEEVDGDAVLDIKVVSNRGDGLSVFGLAREVLAKDLDAVPSDLYNRAAGRFQPSVPAVPGTFEVKIETEDCNRFACLQFDGVQNGSSPDWIQRRLTQAGLRPISLLVDLTNYVMLEVGQPLHVFDRTKLHGPQIVVRKARSGEKLTTLNGIEHELRPDQMMICDADRPVGAAGIMGGADTEVDEATTQVLLESAHFLNTSVRRTRKQLGLSTDASYRFERSVDPDGVVAALWRFAELLATVDGGTSLVPGLVDVYPGVVTRERITLRQSRAVRLLGMEVSFAEIVNYLSRLGMQVEANDPENIVVTPPSWRPDLVREDDLIEEVGRVHGYERIPSWLPGGSTTQGGLAGFALFAEQLKERWLRLGYDQTLSHSLRGLHPLDTPDEVRVQPRIALAPEMQYLRNSLLPGLADAAQRNGLRDVHLFELGNVFAGVPGTHEEWRSLAALTTGRLMPAARANEPSPAADFFSLKGSLLAAFADLGVKLEVELPNEVDPRLHPTRQAILTVSGTKVGVLGELHPDTAEELDFPQAVVVAEIHLARLYELGTEPLKLKPVSRNPAVRRDLSVLFDQSVPFSAIEEAVAKASGGLLERQWLFDVYDGQGIAEGKHSLSIAITLRKQGENFTDEEANQVREQVAAALVELGGTMR
ncbi:MAG: phenylalanine--tRNA ligase subunit beta [Fimbriimonas sp.]